MDIASSNKMVLVFNSANILVGVTMNATAASGLTGLSKKEITYSCKNKTVSSSNFSFRYLRKEIGLDINDIDVLTLEEYDKKATTVLVNMEQQRASFMMSFVVLRLSI